MKITKEHILLICLILAFLCLLALLSSCKVKSLKEIDDQVKKDYTVPPIPVMQPLCVTPQGDTVYYYKIYPIGDTKVYVLVPLRRGNSNVTIAVH